MQKRRNDLKTTQTNDTDGEEASSNSLPKNMVDEYFGHAADAVTLVESSFGSKKEMTIGRLAFWSAYNYVIRESWDNSVPYRRPGLGASWFRQYQSILEVCDEPYYQQLWSEHILQTSVEVEAFLAKCSGRDAPLPLSSPQAIAEADRLLQRVWKDEKSQIRYENTLSGVTIDDLAWGALPATEQSRWVARSGSNYVNHTVSRLIYDAIFNFLRPRWNFDKEIPADFTGKKWPGNALVWEAPPLSAEWRAQYEKILLLSPDSCWHQLYRERVLEKLLDNATWAVSNPRRTSPGSNGVSAADEGAVPGE